MDASEIIKSLNICATAEREYECDGCAYRDRGFDCTGKLKLDAADLIEKLIKERDVSKQLNQIALTFPEAILSAKNRQFLKLGVEHERFS